MAGETAGDAAGEAIGEVEREAAGEAEREAAAVAVCRLGGGEWRGEGGGLARRGGLAWPQPTAEAGCTGRGAEPAPKTAEVSVAAAAVEEAAAAVVAAAVAAAMAGVCHVAAALYGSPNGSL